MHGNFQFDYWARYKEGQNARTAGQPEATNPFKVGSGERDAWAAGYKANKAA